MSRLGNLTNGERAELLRAAARALFEGSKNIDVERALYEEEAAESFRRHLDQCGVSAELLEEAAKWFDQSVTEEWRAR